MTEFKKGDRVQWVGWHSGATRTGTVDRVETWAGAPLVYGEIDGGGWFDLRPDKLTKIDPAPLRPMMMWRANRWVIKNDDGELVAWIAEVAGRYLLGIIGGPAAWYDSLAQAMTAGEVHVRNEAKLRGAA